VGRPRYRLLDHTADLGFEVEAPTWAGLLEVAVAALGDVILGDDGRPATVRREVAVEGADREDLLVAWLGEAVYLYEHEGFVVRRAQVGEADERRVRGTLLGRLTDPAAEPPDRVAKAVTYHGLKVLPGGADGPWRAAVILDL
jgi:SHS2 domain-containing protein